MDMYAYTVSIDFELNSCKLISTSLVRTYQIWAIWYVDGWTNVKSNIKVLYFRQKHHYQQYPVKLSAQRGTERVAHLLGAHFGRGLVAFS